MLNNVQSIMVCTVGEIYPFSYVYAITYDENENIIGINRAPLETEGSTTVIADKTDADNSAKIFVWTDDMQPITMTENMDL